MEAGLSGAGRDGVEVGKALSIEFLGYKPIGLRKVQNSTPQHRTRDKSVNLYVKTTTPRDTPSWHCLDPASLYSVSLRLHSTTYTRHPVTQVLEARVKAVIMSKRCVPGALTPSAEARQLCTFNYREELCLQGDATLSQRPPVKPAGRLHSRSATTRNNWHRMMC